MDLLMRVFLLLPTASTHPRLSLHSLSCNRMRIFLLYNGSISCMCWGWGATCLLLIRPDSKLIKSWLSYKYLRNNPLRGTGVLYITLHSFVGSKPAQLPVLGNVDLIVANLFLMIT